MKTLLICGIYKITSPSGRIYIGQSSNCFKRKKEYKRMACKEQPKLYHSIKKYGWENHKFEIIHECNQEELNDLEIYYINLLNCLSIKNGLNLKEGGVAGKPTKETLIKMSKVQQNRSEEWKINISNANLRPSIEKKTGKIGVFLFVKDVLNRSGLNKGQEHAWENWWVDATYFSRLEMIKLYSFRLDTKSIIEKVKKR